MCFAQNVSFFSKTYHISDRPSLEFERVKLRSWCACTINHPFWQIPTVKYWPKISNIYQVVYGGWRELSQFEFLGDRTIPFNNYLIGINKNSMWNFFVMVWSCGFNIWLWTAGLWPISKDNLSVSNYLDLYYSPINTKSWDTL